MIDDRGQRIDYLPRERAMQIFESRRSRVNSLSTVNYQRHSGFSLFVLFVSIAIVSLLAGILLNRILFYQEQAEKTAMVGVVGALQIALTLQYGQLLVDGMESKVGTLATANPMDWLSVRPPNYAGEFYDPTPASVGRGEWAFDLKSRELIYVLNRADHFSPSRDGQKWIRYRVNLEYAPTSKTPVQADGGKQVGARFGPVTLYRWFD